MVDFSPLKIIYYKIIAGENRFRTHPFGASCLVSSARGDTGPFFPITTIS